MKVFPDNPVIIKGAVRLACSDATIADNNSTTFEELQQKHPHPHPASSIIPFAETTGLPPITVSEEEIIRAIRSFPNDSAGGPDGLRPQHLKDMTGPINNGGAQALISALSRFVTMVLQGKVPISIRPFFFGASLTALTKKDGGIRPIAVGCTLRRLAAKIAGFRVRDRMAALLAPRQLGYGVRGGAEAAVHAARLYLQDLQHQCILKLDFRNAFNTLRRDKMLQAVQKLAPDLLPFVHASYSSPSSLFWWDKIIQSAEGVQQGDPLGPLLFCLTIHPLVSQLKSELCLWYLDDTTIGGPAEDVKHDLEVIVCEGAALGLHLNERKSEVICDDLAARDSILLSIPEAQTIDPESACLLGSPIGDIRSISDAISGKTKLLRTMGDRLQHVSAHDALLLLRNSFALPQLLYLLRTSPSFISPSLKLYDDVLRSIVGTIANTHLDDNAWSQASLPVKAGGLGIRSAVQLAPSAFLSSAAASTNLVRHILPPRFGSQDLLHVDSALASWSLDQDNPPPVAPASHRQKVWDAVKVSAMANSLLENAPDAQSRARLMAASTKESGAWLNALPISSLGLRMDDNTVRVSVGLRLGTTLCRPHDCFHCGAEVNHLGTHGLSCVRSEGLHNRHAALNDIVHRALTAAHIPSRLEPSGIFRSDGKRPDGITLVPWKSGRLLVWDATCPDTFAPSYLPTAASGVGEVAAAAEERKKRKYSHLDQCHLFVPVAIETSGVFGPETMEFLRELGRRLQPVSADHNSFIYLIQRLSVAVQRGNAASVLGSAGNLGPHDFFEAF